MTLSSPLRPQDDQMSLPTGIVTFLFTDIEGSTRLWEHQAELMRTALARHDSLLRSAIQASGGHVFKTIGDAFCAVFPTPLQALKAALAGQRELQADSRETPALIRVRMALHTGSAEQRDDDYFGPPLNRVSRLLDAGHGGQILASLTTAQLLSEVLPEAVTLRDLGSHSLKDLHKPEPIIQVVSPALPDAFPPLRSLAAFAHNLPGQLTSFIGREREIASIKQILSGTPLLTITGVGGTGKTRLALQVAADLLDEYPDGAWLVELAPLSEFELVPQAVGSVFGIREQPGTPLIETIGNALRTCRLLLLLDNCEHVIGACAALSEALLTGCPGVRILATSREALNIAGETVHSLRSLSLPNTASLPSDPAALSGYEAVRLFVDRARAAMPSFEMTDRNAGAIAQICCRVDGIPLAIELAAARVRALPVEKIGERLGDMFRLLTGGSRTALPRQQTLRALIDWSYDLLSASEKTLLQRLSVFAGGWSLDAAEAAASGDGIEAWEVLDMLASLVDKSLVLYDEQSGEARYRLLETVKQYARDRLLETGVGAAVHDRHRDWFLQLAEEAAPGLHGRKQGYWLDRLEAEHDNLRLALDWCVAETAPGNAGLRLAVALVWFWTKRGDLSEGRHRLEEALSRAGENRTRLHMLALAGAGRLAMLGGDYAAAVSLLSAGLDLARKLEDAKGMALALSALAVWASNANNGLGAAGFAEESVQRAGKADERWLYAFCLQVLSWVTRGQNEPEQTGAVLSESLAAMRETGDSWSMILALQHLGALAQSAGQYEQARSDYEEGLILSQELKDRRGMAWCVECLAEVAVAQGRMDRGARLLAAGQSLLASIGATWPPNYAASHETAIALVQTAIGDAAFSSAWEEGYTMPQAQIVVFALGRGDEAAGEIAAQTGAAPA
jgi:predicted ATPase/class 3 adenylate cyclase